MSTNCKSTTMKVAYIFLFVILTSGCSQKLHQATSMPNDLTVDTSYVMLSEIEMIDSAIMDIFINDESFNEDNCSSGVNSIDYYSTIRVSEGIDGDTVYRVVWNNYSNLTEPIFSKNIDGVINFEGQKIYVVSSFFNDEETRFLRKTGRTISAPIYKLISNDIEQSYLGCSKQLSYIKAGLNSPFKLTTEKVDSIGRVLPFK